MSNSLNGIQYHTAQQIVLFKTQNRKPNVPPLIPSMKIVMKIVKIASSNKSPFVNSVIFVFNGVIFEGYIWY